MFKKWYFLFLLSLLIIPACSLAQEQPAGSKNVKTGLPEARLIQVEAFQYGYSPDPIIVKKGDKIRIAATSRDVTHGFAIKEYGINAVVKKGEVVYIEFTADKVGEFDVDCSVYCGPGHMKMEGKLVVQE